MKEKIITIANKIEQLDVLVAELEQIAEEWELPMAFSMNLNLVLEELVTNIIFYGYTDDAVHEITILFATDDQKIKLELTDDAKAFNPLLAAEPDMNTSIEDMKIGGLGIHLVKKIMDDIQYQRIDDKNILTLTKNLS
jgi:serine/threonine-protein kinase RsbW